jgi:thimet oligopeptidase
MKRDLREFRRLGVDRDDDIRKKVRVLSDEIVAIGQEFDRNIREGAKKVAFAPGELAGLPEDFRKAHPPGPDGQVILSTDYPDYHPFMAYARNAKARERFWRANNTRAPANSEVLSRLLAKRYALATLLGYANWADYTTENKMIGTGKTASEFVDRISAAAAERSRREVARMLARKRKDQPAATRFESWDYGFYLDRVKAEQYRFDAKAARPYFEADHVLQGVLGVSGRLLDLTYRPVQGATAWHPEVRVYDVIGGPSFGERAGQSLGRIYLDLHPRDGKYKHAAQYPSFCSRAGRRLPGCCCNFHGPAG